MGALALWLRQPLIVAFNVVGILVGPSGLALAERDLRRRQGISVIGIQRGERRISSPRPEELLRPGDTLLVTGHPEAVRACQEREAR